MATSPRPHPRPRTTVRIIAMAIAALSVLSLGATPASAATRKVQIVVQNTDKFVGALRAALQEAKRIGADGLALQEVCQSHLPEITRANASWTVHHNIDRINGCFRNTGIDGDHSLTVAVRTARGGTGHHVKLTADPGRDPHLTCVRWGSKPVRRVCSAHIALGKTGVGDDQIRQIRTVTNKWISAGSAVIVGGDFNRPPKHADMNPMYALGAGAHGKFLEAHQLKTGKPARTGAVTAPGLKRKIDYLFFSRNRTPWPQSGATLRVVNTDANHHMLVGSARIRTG